MGTIIITIMRRVRMKITKKVVKVATSFIYFPQYFMSTYSPRQWALASAAFHGLFFVVCYLWQYVLTEAALRELHMVLLRMTFPGFTGMNIASLLIMIIESVIFGFIVGWLFAILLNYFKK